MQIKEFQSTPYYFHLAFRISGGRFWRSPLRVILRLQASVCACPCAGSVQTYMCACLVCSMKKKSGHISSKFPGNKAGFGGKCLLEKSLLFKEILTKPKRRTPLQFRVIANDGRPVFTSWIHPGGAGPRAWPMATVVEGPARGGGGPVRAEGW